MEKKDLYPPEKEVKDMLIGKGWIFPEDSALKLTAIQGAELGADYAVKKVIEGIQRVVDEAPYNQKILSVIGYLSELEKLMELDK